MTAQLISVGRKNGSYVSPLEVSGNFIRVPQLLKYGGWCISHFIHQLPQDPQLSPLEIPVNVAALAPSPRAQGCSLHPRFMAKELVSDDFFVRTSVTRRAHPALCIISCLSQGPLWPLCVRSGAVPWNHAELALVEQKGDLPCSLPQAVIHPVLPVLCLRTSRQGHCKIIAINWKCPPC